MPVVGTNPWPTSNVHRAGFDAGFFGPHILIPQGVERDVGRVRAAYSEQDFVFQHSLQAITVPPRQKRKANVLPTVLNRCLGAGVYFHYKAKLGAAWAKVTPGQH